MSQCPLGRKLAAAGTVAGLGSLAMSLPWLQVPTSDARAVQLDLESRICVRPPYFALHDLALEGLDLHATAMAESPAFGEVGPMPAAELGRHAAIVGLSAAAMRQADDRRRYYLARKAICRYTPNASPYGTPVRFVGRTLELDKRSSRAAITATAGGATLASFEVDYTILTESAFERLFRVNAKDTPSVPSPYGALLTNHWSGTSDSVEQVVAGVPVTACAGHFEGYPALPVAVLMGQLSYLAGRLHGGRYRVIRGEVEASDLAWAGERTAFHAARDGVGGHPDAAGASRYRCQASAEGRPVGAMTLWLESVDEGVADQPLFGDRYS